MHPSKSLSSLLFVAILGSASTSPGGVTEAFQSATLPSGLRLIQAEHHASGLVAAAVMVRAGAAWETAEMNGAAHFLEHLLFNGTESRTQEELYRDIDRLGAYVNATTRRDHALYLLVCAREDVADGLALLADMLFRSTLPPENFEKERGIIIEEIGKDQSSPDYAVDRMIEATFGRDIAYARPILGSVDSIEAMDRVAVADYYHRFYVPSNMTLLLLGDLDWEGAREVVERSFDPGVAGERWRAEIPRRPSLEPKVTIHDASADRTTVAVRFPSIPSDSPDLPALLLLGDLLGGDTGRLQAALRAEPALQPVDASATASIEEAATFIEVRARFDTTLAHREVARRLMSAVDRLATEPIPAKELAAAKVARLSSETRMAEQIHYVGIMRADLIMYGPTELLADAPGVYGAVGAADVQRLARHWMDRSRPAEMVVVGPNLEFGIINEDPRDWAAPSAVAAATERQADHTTGRDPWQGLLHDPTPARAARGEQPRRIVLANGLTVLLSTNPDSRVFAVHFAARGRSYREPEGKAGIADVLHRALPTGAGPWSREDLGYLLDRAGIELKVTDSPWIPYDDYYTSHQFSYIRLESVDMFYREALALLATMVTTPLLDDAGVDEAQRDAVDLARRRAASTGDRASELLRTALWGDSKGARPELGTVESLESITPDEVRDFHAEYFAPENLVLAVVSGVEPEVLLGAIEESFGSTVPVESAALEAGGVAPTAVGAEPPELTTEPRLIEETVGGEQAWIRVGAVTEIDERDRAPLSVAVNLLSSNMAFELRERRGLAYSVGAGVAFHDDRARLSAGIGTRAGNIETARQGLESAIREFDADAITRDDIVKLTKKDVGRQRMRRITRIGQAYALTMDELAGRPLGSSREESTGLLEVEPEDIRRVTGTHLRDLPLVTVIVR